MPTIVNVSPEATLVDDSGEEIPLQVIEATVETSRYNEAAFIQMKGLADATPSEINQIEVFDASVSISVNNTVIGSAMLNTLSVDGEGVVELEGYDAVRTLLTTPVGQQYKSASTVEILGDIFDAAGIGEGEELGRPSYAYEGLFSVDEDETTAGENEAFYTSKNFNDTSCAEAIHEICLERGWNWYVDAENTVWIVSELDPDIIDLNFITETSAGLQSPPYKRVIVTGGRGTSMESSDSETHLLSKTKVQGIAGVEDPTYTYQDASLHTPEAAQRVAEGILEEFYMQRASGEVTAVGRPDVRPLDVIDLPEDLVGDNSEFIVSSVAHELTGSDGYLTTIAVGSRVDPEEIESQPGNTAPEDDDIPAGDAVPEEDVDNTAGDFWFGGSDQGTAATGEEEGEGEDDSPTAADQQGR